LILKILVLGIGNVILQDDGVGPAIVRELSRLNLPPDVFLKTTSLSGFPLLDIVTGFSTLIIVDATKSERKTGEITWEPAGTFQPRTEGINQHTMDLFRVLELGRQLELEIPTQIMVLTIGARDVTSFGEFLSPEVAAAVPEATAEIMRKIIGLTKDKQPINSQRTSPV
jgi:hydrogenase maturation protease